MPDKIICDARTQRAVSSLGKLIKRCHSGTSQAEIARQIGIPRSTLMYIENGQNAPSPKVYQGLIDVLHPCEKDRNKMDGYFMQIRETPPPDVCKSIITRPDFVSVIRKLETKKLSDEQMQDLMDHICSYGEERGTIVNE